MLRSGFTHWHECLRCTAHDGEAWRIRSVAEPILHPCTTRPTATGLMGSGGLRQLGVAMQLNEQRAAEEVSVGGCSRYSLVVDDVLYGNDHACAVLYGCHAHMPHMSYAGTENETLSTIRKQDHLYTSVC